MTSQPYFCKCGRQLSNYEEWANCNTGEQRECMNQPKRERRTLKVRCGGDERFIAFADNFAFDSSAGEIFHVTEFNPETEVILPRELAKEIEKYLASGHIEDHWHPQDKLIGLIKKLREVLGE